MKPIDEIIDSFMVYMEAVLPDLLNDLSLPDFEKYIQQPPVDPDLVTLSAYMSNGNHNESDAEETFMLQAQLPAVMNPAKHHKAIQEGIRQFDPNTVYADTLGSSYVTFYPGEVQDGAGSSFIVYEIQLMNELDDCQDDEDF